MANAVQFKLNGVAHSFDGDPETPLLWYLRDTLGLTGTKFGCGVGLCGACTVHKNGDAIRACITPMSSLAGAEVRTIEDIGANGLHPVQKMWMQFNVPQCGYCQSGQIMRAIALLKSKPKPTDEDIDEGMAANICRCGTYQRIRAAIKAAAEERSMSAIAKRESTLRFSREWSVLERSSWVHTMRPKHCGTADH